jgi:2-hydroxymuconate-semialdehyde hydrolase
MPHIASRFVMVDGVRTHYLSGGAGPTLVLLHSGEFGGSAEITWEFNIQALAEHFTVLAPDWLGFGKTDKWFSFDDMWAARVNHLTRFLEVMCVGRAHFMGNSMGGSILAEVAALGTPDWQIDRMVLVSGGGYAPDNDQRAILNSYDGTREHMRRIIEVLCRDESIRGDEAYLDRRFAAAQEPGAWECTAAARFRAPWVKGKGRGRPDYSNVRIPTLIIAGGQDPLREPSYGTDLQAQIMGSELLVYPNASHCSQIDARAQFNQAVPEFLLRAR